jgi:quinolinate synthase
MNAAYWEEEARKLSALSDDELLARIHAAKQRWGKDLCILAHLYQRKQIGDVADFTGDSFLLSQKAAAFDGGKYIVFAGVRFMAESAAILARPEQKVVHPDPEAGCPMADMAALPEVERAWDVLSRDGGPKIVPVTYMNSTADIKAFCGKHEGTICTSSNADKTFRWAFERGGRVFFLPDEHLGRNTAFKLGLTEDDLAIWDPEKDDGGDRDRYAEAKVVLWRGYCPVHKKFSLRDVEHVRKFYPAAKVLVHPECPADVVAAADFVGSTEYIRRWVAEASKPGDQIFIGTEINLVQNLQAQYPDRLVAKLHRSLCLTMYQITLAKLCVAVEHPDKLEKVAVDDATKHWARVALDRMLELT